MVVTFLVGPGVVLTSSVSEAYRRLAAEIASEVKPPRKMCPTCWGQLAPGHRCPDWFRDPLGGQ